MLIICVILHILKYASMWFSLTHRGFMNPTIKTIYKFKKMKEIKWSPETTHKNGASPKSHTSRKINNNYMRIKSILLACLVLASILFTACGGGKSKTPYENKSTNLTVETKMTGPLSENFEVINAILKTEATSYSSTTKLLVEVKRTAVSFSFKIAEAEVCGVGEGKKYTYCISADVYNAAGIPIATNLEKYGYESFEKCLTLNVDETIWLEFSCGASHEEVKKVKLSSSLEKNDNSTVSNTSNNETNNDCAQFLKDYEEFANSYIKIIKKYKQNPTDPTILSEYTTAASKAIEMQTEASNCTDAKYASKLAQIASKMAMAAI